MDEMRIEVAVKECLKMKLVSSTSVDHVEREMKNRQRAYAQKVDGKWRRDRNCNGGLN